MSTRECAVSVLASLPEEKMKEFIYLFADDNTIARMQTEAILQNPENYKHYDSVMEMFEETLNEEI
ncbi:MAG: hypothetical protein NC078_07205 [Ruminococcus sp.]|nr:hypothetical protein [Ruminococcus sp.]